jgi:hypothetical protein
VGRRSTVSRPGSRPRIAGLVVRAGHRGSLCWGPFIAFGRAVGSGRTARVVVGRRVAKIELEALYRGPGLDQCAIDLEMLVRQKRRDLAMGEDCGHHLARHVGAQQPVEVLGKDLGDSDWGVDPQPHEPPEQEVVLHLLHQLALRPD